MHKNEEMQKKNGLVNTGPNVVIHLRWNVFNENIKYHFIETTQFILAVAWNWWESVAVCWTIRWFSTRRHRLVLLCVFFFHIFIFFRVWANYHTVCLRACISEERECFDASFQFNAYHKDIWALFNLINWLLWYCNLELFVCFHHFFSRLALSRSLSISIWYATEM